MIGRIPVTDVSPVVDCGTRPARAVVGERLRISATVFREGHDAVAASVALTAPDGRTTVVPRMRPLAPGTDRWDAELLVDAPGVWSFVVEGWSDPFGTWHHGAEVKLAAGVSLTVELEEGARIIERAVKGVPAEHHALLSGAVDALRAASRPVEDRVARALSAEVAQVLHDFPLRELVSPSERYEVYVDRTRALFGSWYEFFPRSEGAYVPPDGGPMVSGTFRTAAERLPAVAEMGFDVVYLPPIHPVGEVNRKGPNNTLTPGAHDPGSPWAIGSRHGGHDAVHPDLGTVEDFDAFVERARALGMEVALDLALQCAPDHPWAKEHPEWFTVLPDGTIAYAENPPKKYQDIYPINFDNDPEGLYAEVLRVVLHWVDHGVKIFRVDNPHTKPVQFWEWLIWEVKQTHPEVLFLSEAFTRPAMMHTLAKVGFTQSYTYFTWRTTKAELQDYVTELTGAAADYMRPNFFVNTPDILHAYLQYGGPPAFKVRAVLAALLSPSWGVYAGYELFEHVAVRPRSEEYLDSEKYQYRPRDWAAAEREGRSLAPYLTMLNRLRHEHPALQWLRNVVFHPVDQPEVMAWSKRLGDGPDADTVLVVVNLDPHGTREATGHWDMPALGLNWDEPFEVHDHVTGATYRWRGHDYVRLDPHVEPAHVLTVRRLT